MTTAIPARQWPLAVRLGVLLAILVLGTASGVAVALGEPEAAVATALAVPVAVLLLRYPFTAVLLWVAAMPFFASDDDPSVSPPVWLLHRLMIPGMILLVLVYRGLGVSRVVPFRLTLADWAIIVFGALSALNILVFSQNPLRMFGMAYDEVAIPIAMYWLVRLLAPTAEDLRRLVPVAAAVVVLQVTVGALAWLAPSALPGQWLGRLGERTVGTLGGPGPYSITLILFGLLLLHAAMQTESRAARTALLLLVTAAFGGIAMTLSRGSWLGAGFVLVGLLWVYPRVSLWLATGGVLILLALGAGGQLDVAAERLADAETAASRVVTNDAALRMIDTEPMVGFGYGNFERFDEDFKRRVGDLAVQPGSAHHTYLALAAEMGIPLSVLYLFPAIWLLVTWWRHRSRVPDRGFVNRAFLVLLWLAVIDQVVVSNFMDMLHSSAWGTTLWWMTLGLIHATLVPYLGRQRRRMGEPLLSAEQLHPGRILSSSAAARSSPLASERRTGR